jgi:acyl-coenzyme A thioesterase PaaI-like protein
MINQERLQELMVQHVPFNQLLGICVEAVRSDSVEVLLPERPSLLNHVRTLHATAQFGLAEATSGTMIVSAFADLLQTDFVPLAVEATVKYRRPAQGTLRRTVSLSQEQQSEIRTRLAQSGRARIPLSVRVLTEQNIAVMELEIIWMVLRQRAGKG